MYKMSQIKIIYHDINNNNALLGEELFDNIEACELPYDPENENIFIRKVFSNITPSNWKVIDIQITDDTSSKKLLCEIYLSAINYTPSSIAAKHGSNGSKLLRGRSDVRIDNIEIQTQATDAKGIAQEIPGNLKDATWHFDDGLRA